MALALKLRAPLCRICRIDSIYMMKRFSSDAPPSKLSTEEEKEKLIYQSDQHFTIRVMFAAGIFNAVYWSYYLANAYYYHDVVIDGVAMGGNTIFGAVGALGTGLILMATRQYAVHTVKRAYEVADGKRLGFQTFNIYGSRGRKLEAMHYNVRAQKKPVSKNLQRIHLEGMDRDLFIDVTGRFYGDRLKNILADADKPVASTSTGSKSERVAKIKEMVKPKRRD